MLTQWPDLQIRIQTVHKDGKKRRSKSRSRKLFLKAQQQPRAQKQQARVQHLIAQTTDTLKTINIFHSLSTMSLQIPSCSNNSSKPI
jgi:predicted transcriptional regulator